MSYKAEISRKHPSAFVFLIDQSRSMGSPWGSTDKNGDSSLIKAQAVADVVNSFLDELINRCQKEGGTNDYFDIALLGYGKKGGEAYFAWEPPLQDKDWCPVSELKTNFADTIEEQVEVIIRGKKITEKQIRKIWIKPVASGTTPMKAALSQTKELLEDWIKEHSESFPPIVINITDAAATDISDRQELIDVANEIKSLKTTDGNVIIFNCHISSSKSTPTILPATADELSDNDENAHMLFAMSSELPPKYNNLIIEVFDKDPISFTSARGMAYNIRDINGLTKLLDIGTRVAVNSTSNIQHKQ